MRLIAAYGGSDQPSSAYGTVTGTSRSTSMSLSESFASTAGSDRRDPYTIPRFCVRDPLVHFETSQNEAPLRLIPLKCSWLNIGSNIPFNSES